LELRISKARNKKYSYKVLPCSSSGQLERFLKYQLAWLAAKGLNQNEYPERPIELPLSERDGFLIGGSFYRYLSNYFKRLPVDSRVSSQRAQLAWGFAQVKRASEPAPIDFVAANMKKHKERLTRSDPLEEDDQLFDSLKEQVIRTVEEVFGGVKKFKERVRVPSMNAHFKAPRSMGGALGKYFNSAFPLDELLIAMYETVPGQVWELRGYITDEVIRQTYDDARHFAWSQDQVKCIPHPVMEPFKVRVITLGEPEAYWLAKNYQDLLWKQLCKFRTFRFIGSPDSASSINEHLSYFEYNPKFDNLVSVDYEAATDNLHPELSEVVLEKILALIDAPLADRRILLQCLTGHELHYRTDKKDEFDVHNQTWGQLMGSPVSFPILCLINAAVLRHAYEIANGYRSVALANCPLFINGDDALMIMPKDSYELLGRLTSKVGLKFSVGKNYRSEKYAVINSHLYEGTIVPDYFGVKRLVFSSLPYINMGLLCGKGRVQSSGFTSVDPFTEGQNGGTIGQKHQILLEGHSEEIQKKLTTEFIKRNQETLNKIKHIGWFIPSHLGGLGLKWVGETDPKITPYQSKLCAYLECINSVESMIANKILSDRTIRPNYVDYSFGLAAKIGDKCGFTFEKTDFELPDFSTHFLNMCDGSGTDTKGSRFEDSFQRIFKDAQKTKLNGMSWAAIRLSKPKKLYLRRPWSTSML